ncbi:MAG: EipA family protein [Hyphomicrobiaceae bacterium]
MRTYRRYGTLLVLATVLFIVPAAPSLAQSKACKPGEIDALIDATGDYLRTFSLKQRPLLHEKFEKLGKLKNWPAEAAIDRGYQFTHSKTIVDLDNRARKLLIDLDKIGARSSEADACRDLDRLKAITLELRTVTQAKFSRMMTSVDSALQEAETKRVAKAKPPEPPVKPNLTAKPRPAPKVPPWQTTTESAPSPAVISALPSPDAMPAETTYTPAEIREAGRGFFGNLSAGLASVIQYTFETYGRPNGYILGSEGGAAFLAGISFGKGRLNTKLEAPRKVFWQGPTVGYDLGLQGSRVMILVYNLKQPDQIFRRYGGIGGSAYVVGGVGLTYHKRGNVVLAPIRTGLGLRLGANIGYLKFTPKLSINPF